MKFRPLSFAHIRVIAIGLLLVFQTSNAQVADGPGAKLRTSSYDGRWSGTVNCLYDPGLWPEDECAVRFTFDIKGANINIDQIVRSKSGEETKSTIKPGKFLLIRRLTNAAAISLETGNDEDGTWVETWSFSMTLTDPDHMLVHWVRVVNNIDMPRNAKGSKFSLVGMGEFSRDKPGA